MKKVEKSAAILTIKNPSSMTKAGRKRIAEWLMRQASDLIKEGDNYSDRFVARYLYK